MKNLKALLNSSEKTYLSVLGKEDCVSPFPAEKGKRKVGGTDPFLTTTICHSSVGKG